MTYIVCLGDSITWSGDPLTQWASYCGLSSLPTINVATPGVTAGYWVQNLGEVPLEGNLVSLMIGTNDVSFNVSPASFRGQLEALFDITGGGVLHVPPYRQGPDTGLISTPYDGEVEVGVLNARLDLLILEMEEVIEAREDVSLGFDWRGQIEYPGDGGWNDITHPSTAGHTLVVGRIDDILMTAVPEPDYNLMLAVGLVVLAFLGRQRRSKSNG